MYAFLIAAYKNLKEKVCKHLHHHSLVERWRQRHKDEDYLQGQIQRLRDDTLTLEGFFEDNPFCLEALNAFPTSEVNYRDTRTRRELLKGHNIANCYIFENRKRFERSAPQFLQEYFISRKEFEEQLQRLDTETSS